MNYNRSRTFAMLAATCLLAALFASFLALKRPEPLPAPGESALHKSPAGTTRDVPAPSSLDSPTAAPRPETQNASNRVMDKVVVVGMTRTLVEVVDRHDDLAAGRLKKALVAYRGISREVISEYRERETHLSDVALKALEEVYAAAE